MVRRATKVLTPHSLRLAAHSSRLTPHPLPPTGVNTVTTVMGFDYGTRRIGIAVGNAISHSARALEVLTNAERGPDWPRLDVLLREWRPDALLVGLPLTVKDSEQSTSQAARGFAAELARRYELPVTLVDERHSSREAAQRIAERRAGGAAKRKHAATLDADAAAIIVERWLDHG